jgi:hypothetical protein
MDTHSFNMDHGFNAIDADKFQLEFLLARLLQYAFQKRWNTWRRPDQPDQPTN